METYGTRYSTVITEEYLRMTLITSVPFRYMLISSGMFFTGMLFYAFYNKLIIIRLPVQRAALFERRSAFRKQVPLWYFNGSSYIKDDKELIISSNTQSTLQDIVASWLSFIEEEQGLPNKTSVQAVMLDAHKHTAYISFDRKPFAEKQSTYEKLMFIEGLLKTLKDSPVPLKKVQILVHHTPLEDPHLDFSKAWSISGYIA